MAEILVPAHGNGAGALLRAETPATADLDDLNADDTRQGIAEAKRRGRPFQLGNAAAEGRKPSLARLSVEASSPRYKAALKRAARYRDRRVREFALAHGGEISAGVAAMLASAARALAASVVLAELADESLRSGSAKSNRVAAEFLGQSARLADSHRQQELTAQAICERETKARMALRKDEDLTWLTGGPAKPKKTPTSRSAAESPGALLAAPNLVEGDPAVDSEAVDESAEETAS